MFGSVLTIFGGRLQPVASGSYHQGASGEALSGGFTSGGMGSWSTHSLQGFGTIPRGFLPEFWTINSSLL